MNLMLGHKQEIPNHENVTLVYIVVSYRMLMFIDVLPWIQAMYKIGFCQLEMILENDKQFETLPNI